MTLVPTSSSPSSPPSPPASARPWARRVFLAHWIAAGVDLVQIVAWPFFAPGAPSIANDLLDVATAFVLSRLLGWHFAFLPTFLAELVPGIDLVPTWSIAVFIATRRKKAMPVNPTPSAPD